MTRPELDAVPTSITRAQLTALCTALGIPDPRDIARLEVRPHVVEVDLYARHPVHGGRYRDGDKPAMHRLAIPVVP